jgi:hypothetical protein
VDAAFGHALSESWRNQLEHRYHLDVATAQRVIAELSSRLHQIRHDPAAAQTLVATTYLDSPDDFYYRAACAAQDHAIKLRIREYLAVSDSGELAAGTTCFVERKERHGVNRRKDRVQVRKSDVAGILRGAIPLPDRSPAAVALRRELEAHLLAPVVTSLFARTVYGDGSALRITYDQEVRFHRPPAGLYEAVPSLAPHHLGPLVAAGPDRNLEVKRPVDLALPDWLESLLRHCPPATDYSKFIAGVTAARAQPA